MTPRYAAALTAVLLAAGASPALAAPKAVCQQVTDVAGDGTTAGVLPNRDAIDILGGDLATGRRNLVAVLRLASVEADPTLTPGVTYRFSWRAGTIPQALSVVRYSDGAETVTFDPNTSFGASGDEQPARLLVDHATNSLVWTVARKANPVLAKKGTKFSGMELSAEPALNLGTPSGTPVNFSSSASFLGGDTAASGKTYTDLAPSCVKGV